MQPQMILRWRPAWRRSLQTTFAHPLRIRVLELLRFRVPLGVTRIREAIRAGHPAQRAGATG
ncbi:MAG: hypothetical protein MUQ32_15490, partial [Chloroflexi bacterium]|nr:hypothetical protein [Chloroflexota bacterium]